MHQGIGRVDAIAYLVNVSQQIELTTAKRCSRCSKRCWKNQRAQLLSAILVVMHDVTLLRLIGELQMLYFTTARGLCIGNRVRHACFSVCPGLEPTCTAPCSSCCFPA